LLLVHGWPQTWYQWRLVMPALARDSKPFLENVRLGGEASRITIAPITIRDPNEIDAG
jgi:hypothetical protein